MKSCISFTYGKERFETVTGVMEKTKVSKQSSFNMPDDESINIVPERKRK